LSRTGVFNISSWHAAAGPAALKDAVGGRQSQAACGDSGNLPNAISRVMAPPLRQRTGEILLSSKRCTPQDTAPEPYLPINRPPVRKRSSE
jgi:hypothetical protein